MAQAPVPRGEQSNLSIRGVVSAGPRVSETPWREGFEQPLVTWIPSIALSGMTFYTGNRFPAWKGNIFVDGMRYGEIPPSGRLERVVFNDKMEELRRESLLTVSPDRRRRRRAAPDRTGAVGLQLQHPDAMVFAVADIDSAALDENAVRPGESARERIAVGAVAALAGSNDSGHGSLTQVDAADHMVFGVGNIETLIGRIRDALRTVQRIPRRAKPRRYRRAAIARISQLACAGDVFETGV